MTKINTSLFKKATKLCAAYDSTISFGYTGEGSEVDVNDRHIIIDLYEIKDLNTFWSMVFHELAHMYCYDNEIFYTYHYENLTEKEMGKYIRKMGLKIERFVDRLGMKLMKEHGFEIDYVPAYLSKEDVEWYKQWIEKTYPT